MTHIHVAERNSSHRFLLAEKVQRMMYPRTGIWLDVLYDFGAMPRRLGKLHKEKPDAYDLLSDACDVMESITRKADDFIQHGAQGYIVEGLYFTEREGNQSFDELVELLVDRKASATADELDLTMSFIQFGLNYRQPAIMIFADMYSPSQKYI